MELNHRVRYEKHKGHDGLENFHTLIAKWLNFIFIIIENKLIFNLFKKLPVCSNCGWANSF